MGVVALDLVPMAVYHIERRGRRIVGTAGLGTVGLGTPGLGTPGLGMAALGTAARGTAGPRYHY